MLSLGIDYDAGEWEVAAWDEQAAADLHTLRSPGAVWEFVDAVLAQHPATPIVLPSGLGVPLTRAADLMDRDIAEITLDADGRAAGDLGPFLAEARRRALRAFCIPAVKLLPSVPPHRKLNRLDLGTAGALCAAAWIIHSTATRSPDPAACSGILAHAAREGICLLAIRAGRIVDGTGRVPARRAPAPGMPPHGPLPCEAPRAPLRPRLQASHLAAALAEAEGEELAKAALGLLRFHDLPHLLLSGGCRTRAERLLAGRVPLAPAPPGAGFEAALGAAVLAAGLTGGPTAGLVQQLGLREARERVVDWVEAP